MKKLSIITPYYKTLEETKKLAKALEPQITDDVEWIIVDDGCMEKELDNIKARIIHTLSNSGGASKPRNIGLDNAKGEYIAFIDSDDTITEDYIATILFAIEHFMPDIIYLSWKSKVHNVVMKTRPPKWNCSVWCRVYKKSLIGKNRFKENLRIAEDLEFNTHIHPMSATVIKKQVYIYNNGREGSLTNAKD